MMTPEGEKWGDDIIARTLALLARLPQRAVSPDTQRVYKNTMKRMAAENFDPLRPGDARGTYGVRRAALHYRTRIMLERELSMYDEARRCGDHEEMQLCLATLEATLQLTHHAIELDPPLGQGAASFDAAASRWREQEAPPQRGKGSKKHVLKKLPADWTNRVWAAAPDSWKYRDALAIHMLAPVRPSELLADDGKDRKAGGVAVELWNDELLMRVSPKKSHDGKFGTDETILRFDSRSSNPAIVHLVSLCRRKRGRTVVGLKNTNGMRKALAYLGQKALGDDAPTITGYVYRHKCIADLKKTVGAGAVVAAAAGHCTDRTQSHYGRVENGSRRPDFIGAVAKRQPKAGHAARARELGEARQATLRSGPAL